MLGDYAISSLWEYEITEIFKASTEIYKTVMRAAGCELAAARWERPKAQCMM